MVKRHKKKKNNEKGLAMKLLLSPTYFYQLEMAPLNFIVGTAIWLILSILFSLGLSSWLQLFAFHIKDHTTILLSVFTGFTTLFGLTIMAVSFRWTASTKKIRQIWGSDKIKNGATFVFIAMGITTCASLFSAIFLKENFVAFMFTLFWAFVALVDLGLLTYKAFGLGFCKIRKIHRFLTFLH